MPEEPSEDSSQGQVEDWEMVTMREIATMKEIEEEMEEMGGMVKTVETTVVKKIDGSENSRYDIFMKPTKLTDDERRP